MRLPAVCVPGTFCDARLFAPMLDHLDLDAAVLPLAGASVGEAAAAVLAAAPPRFVAIGFSLGGFVVLELLRQAPARLLGAVLIASHAEPDTRAAAAERARQLRLLVEDGSAALIADRWPRYAAARTLPDVRATILAMAATFTPDDFAAQSSIAASRPDSRSDGPHDASARVPLLVIGGDADLLCPPERGYATAMQLGGRYVSIPRAGHLVPLEAPLALAAAIGDWLGVTQDVTQEALLCG